MSTQSGIAIVGMGCMLPEAGTLAEAWRNIETGKDCIRDIPLSHWQPDDYFNADPQAPDCTYAKRGGFLRPYKFRPLDWGITPNAIEATDTSQILGMVVAHHALADAGMGPDQTYDRSRVSVIMGVTGTLSLVIPLGARLGHPLWRRALADAGVDSETAQDVIERIKAGYVGWQTASFPGLLGNVVAGRIANRFDLGGTNCVVDAACASSLAAIHLAILELEAGRADAVVTGGVDTFNDIFMYMCFSKTPALSPHGDARPFDQRADGTALGEGVGALVLKRLADAERDGDRIYAVIRSMGTASDGHGQAIYAPAAKGQRQALQRAYVAANISPETVRLVEAHGTGTKVGDAVEIQALTEVYRAARPEGAWCSLGTIKSQVGHTKAAAGVAGLIKATLALHKKVLPPSIKVEQPADGLRHSPFHLEKRARPWIKHPDFPRRAGVSAFGFGGSNFHCVLEEASSHERGLSNRHDLVGILAYSATSTEHLNAAMQSDLAALASMVREDPGDAAEQLRKLGSERRASFDGQAPRRLILVLETPTLDAEVLLSLARRLSDRLTTGTTATWVEGQQAYFDSRIPQGKVAVLFPGQGAQYPGMLQALACRTPELRQAVEEADAAYTARHGRALELANAVFPPSAWNDAEKTSQQNHLMATERAQPGIGAVSLGAMETLKNLGFCFDAAAGHSFGELTALCAAGWLAPTDFHALAVERGALMADNGDDRGSMMAVAADRATVVDQLSQHGLELVVANHNAPKQVVIAGPRRDIDRASTVFLSAGFGAKRLDVAAAFHSPLVASATEPFAQALHSVPLHPQVDCVVYANRSATPYPLDPDAARALLAEQIASPVEFVAMIQRMLADGVRCFVEVGPGRRLCGLVGAIADDPTIDRLALDDSGAAGDGLVALAHLVARLAVRGCTIDLKRWDADFKAAPETSQSGLTIAISGANHFEPKPPATRKVKRQMTMSETTSLPTPARSGAMSYQGDVSQAAKPMDSVTAATAPAAAGVHVPVTTVAPSSSTLTEPSLFMQQAIVSLQRLQEQNAELHRQFLQNQMLTQSMLFNLLNSQGGAALPVAARPMSAPVMPTVRHEPSAVPPPPAPSFVVSQPAVTTTVHMTPAPLVTAQAPSSMPQAPTPRSVRAGASAKPQTASSSSSSSSSSPNTRDTLLAIVAEKTGYPIAMLDSQMSLEADLGIDSIKRVEILAELQNRLPHAASVPAEELSKLATLAEIVTRLNDGAADQDTPLSQDDHNQPSRLGADQTQIAAALVAIVAEKTGYPAEMVGLDMQIESDLGIDSIKRVEILSALQEQVPSSRAAPAEVLARCRTLQEIAETAAHAAVEKKN